jgi:hypothetical protein
MLRRLLTLIAWWPVKQVQAFKKFLSCTLNSCVSDVQVDAALLWPRYLTASLARISSITALTVRYTSDISLLVHPHARVRYLHL